MVRHRPPRAKCRFRVTDIIRTVTYKVLFMNSKLCTERTFRYMSRIMFFCIILCENKRADQLHGNRAAD